MKGNKSYRRFPVISHGAEFLIQGYLMRRNILTFKAPPKNEGYDLICIHPDSRKTKKHIRVQVKSRYQSDSNWSFPVKEESVDAFDYLIAVFLNIGNYLRKKGSPKSGRKDPVFYTLPVSFVKKHLRKRGSWEQIRLGKLRSEIEEYKNYDGFDLIANELGISYPSRNKKGR